jgi:hypothetical protein
MKNVFKMTAAALSAAAALQAQAGVVFESFANYPTAGATALNGCSSCTGYGALAASFTLSADQTLNKAFVLINPLTDPANNSFTVSIFADGGNDLPLLAGADFSTPLFFLNYTLHTSLTPEPGGTELAEMDLPNWNVTAGRYWIRFAGYSMTMPIYHTADPAHSRVVGTQLFGGAGITRNAADEAIGFSLNAVDQAPDPGNRVPEPASAGLVLVALAGLRWASRRRAA